MSYADVSRFVTLGLDDVEVRERMKSDPGGAFQGYDLTEQEREAVASGDERALVAMGLDPMTAHSWSAFHNVESFAPDRPDVPGDLPTPDQKGNRA